MQRAETSDAARPAIGGVTRKPVTQGQTSWVRTEFPSQSGKNTVVITADVEGLQLQPWSKNNRSVIADSLRRYGAVLFRNFAVAGWDHFEHFMTDFAGDLLEYKERSSPRHQVQGKIYSSTDYPAHQSIFLHNENSYQHMWPMKIAFYCHIPAQDGGETPIADTREIFRLLSSATLKRFTEKRCMYVRNFDGQFGLPWQVVFQTHNRDEVENYCRRVGMTCEWRGENHLRTRSVRSAIATHPQTGESLWFNHLAFFHCSTLEPEVREGLLATMKEEDLPSNSYYGDGQPIEPEVLDEIREAYRKAAIVFSWHKGDVLILDNMLMAHSRAPFKGERKIMVAMAEPYGPTFAGASDDRSMI
jgi:alpha-ketoglutarate-dependent taurine dioxygenase